jgi:hypothetical protein
VAAQQLLSGEIPAVLPYLRSLDHTRLDAEQLRQVQFLTGTTTSRADRVEEIASALVFDSRLWCDWIADGDEATQTRAVAHLAKLWDQSPPEPLAASREMRLTQLEQWRSDSTRTRR